MRLRERPRHYRCTPLQQKLWEGTRAVPGPRRRPPLPQRKASRTTWVNGLPTIPTAAHLAAESISPTTEPGREGNKRCCGAVWYASGCDMTGGADPAQPTYQSPIHHSPPEHYFCYAQYNNITLSIQPPIQLSAVGDRSLIWPRHIAGTPGCSTPKVDNQHFLGNDRSRAQRSASIH